MIFVTVGTHEQQFNRLVKYIDCLKDSGEIEEEVIIQTGYSTYEPKHCIWSSLLPYKEMVKNVSEARIVITHGGPSSFIMPLQVGKIPVVVPRQQQFDEHVNNHQLDFVNVIKERQKNIIPVYDIEKLGEIIRNYDRIITEMPKEMRSNNEKFNERLAEIIQQIFKES